MVKGLVVAALSIFLMVASLVQTSAQKAAALAMGATAELYILNPSVLPGYQGNSRPADICTAWNYKKTLTGYRLITAEHCISLEGEAKRASAPLKFGVAFSNLGDREKIPIVPATVIKDGNFEHVDTDIAILEITTTDVHNVLSLAPDHQVQILDEVLDVSAPTRAEAFSAYKGYVSNPHPDAADYSHEASFVIPGTGRGSSGSAIVDAQSGEVIGIMVLGSDSGEAMGPSAEEIVKFIGK